MFPVFYPVSLRITKPKPWPSCRPVAQLLCSYIVFVKAYFNCVEFIRREVVPGFYLKGHIVRPRLC
jgi:hypothetical protein